MDFGLTLEHTPPGQFPEWLFQQLQDQVLLPTMEPLLVIHSSDASRDELLFRLENSEIGPIDRSRHHTLASLWKSLHADLRLPRLLSSSAAANRLLHSECEQAAREGEFPLLHPTPEYRWGEGRTRALTRLARTFDVENIRSWDGPGIDGFNKRLKRMGKKMNGMHPLLHRRTIIDTLEASDLTPFTITGIAGIVIMDQMPTLSQSDRRLLLSLNRFGHIHQLCQHGDALIGNYRMGFHGAILEDVHPVTEETMPTWLLPHKIWQPTPCTQSVHRVLIPQDGLGIPATLEVLRDWVQSADSNARALIIDPGWKNRAEQWRRGLAEVGLRLSRDTTTLKAAPSIHWLGETASIGQGPEAWSMSRIRGLGTQQSLRFISEWLHHNPHPDHSDWVPEMDANRLESLARSWHILGGHVALSRWLRALASPSYPAPWEDRDEAGRQAECTQWWFLSLLSRLSPLLSSGERALLDETALSVGCFTGAQLPLPPAANDGDQWISHLLANIDWESMQAEAGSLQRFLEEYTHYRSSQLTLEHSIVSIGPKWAEQLLGLIEDLDTPTIIEAGDQIRILAPEEALGVTADIIILTHLTSAGWALRTEKLPWLDEATCKELNLCRPDAPLRDARHALHHLMHASSTVIIIDGSGLDEDCQPAAPIAEWFSTKQGGLNLHKGADSAESVPSPSFMGDWLTKIGDGTRGYHLAWIPSTIEMIRNDGPTRAEVHLSGRSIRDNRQRTGLSLRDSRQPSAPPLRTESISLSLDTLLMQDRLRRQPTRSINGESLGMDLHDRFCGIGDIKIVPSASGAPSPVPRFADSWPVLGGRVGRFQLLANDPRPLAPSPTSLPVFDQRNGFTGGAKGSRERWSASRLQRWQACPRQGWLERRLNAGKIEQQDDDLDARIRGDLVHGSLGALFENVFSLPEHVERSSVGASSLANMGSSVDDMFPYILDYVGHRAPWLEREDATAAQRRHDLIGMGRKSWMDWLSSPKPRTPSGRLGNLLKSEMELCNSIPIAIEWSLDGVTIDHPDGRSMKFTGFIDRVDTFLPFGSDENSAGKIKDANFAFRLEKWEKEKQRFDAYNSALREAKKEERKIEERWRQEVREFEEKMESRPPSFKIYEQKSPYQGRISDVPVEVGNIVSHGQIICTVARKYDEKDIWSYKLAEIVEILVEKNQDIDKGSIIVKLDHALAQLKDRAPDTDERYFNVLRHLLHDFQSMVPPGRFHHMKLDSGSTILVQKYSSDAYEDEHFASTVLGPEQNRDIYGVDLRKNIDGFIEKENNLLKYLDEGLAPYYGRKVESTIEKIPHPVVIDPGPKPEPLEVETQLTVAPLDWNTNHDWTPERLILIRDMKSIDGPRQDRAGNRHRKALFDELQLAIYARAWEVAHPGDLVIGVGVSEVGQETVHRLEVSQPYSKLLENNGVGMITNYTHSTHRLPNESPPINSDAFRAWMLERLTTAFDVADAANSGRVHATPEEFVCRYCRVKEACGLAPIVGGDSTWN